jgi:hypothetical protein
MIYPPSLRFGAAGDCDFKYRGEEETAERAGNQGKKSGEQKRL